MYTTIIHPIRKAFCLSINEYCVLEAIRGLSNNIKYDGWCVMSQPRIANALDLSHKTVQRAYSKLEEIGLINKRNNNPRDTAVRSSDKWNEWFMADKADVLLKMKVGEECFETVQLKTSKCVLGQDNLTPPSGQFDTTPQDNLSYNTNIDIYNDIKIPLNPQRGNASAGVKVFTPLPELLKTEPEEVAKQNTTTLPPVAVAPSQYGNQEVNQMLSFLLGVFGRKDFKETKQFQRNFGKHLVNLYKKMGKEAFKDAIQCIAKDSFKSKNCNSLKYIYGEIKSAKVTTGYIEPTEQERVLNPIGYV